jgi:hypothetical protein
MVPVKLSDAYVCLWSHCSSSCVGFLLSPKSLSCDLREGAEQHYIRVILNDALLPLGQDQGCPSSSLKDGLCPLRDFIDHFEKVSVPAANYQEACFGNGERE